MKGKTVKGKKTEKHEDVKGTRKTLLPGKIARSALRVGLLQAVFV